MAGPKSLWDLAPWMLLTTLCYRLYYLGDGTIYLVCAASYGLTSAVGVVLYFRRGDED